LRICALIGYATRRGVFLEIIFLSETYLIRRLFIGEYEYESGSIKIKSRYTTWIFFH